MCFQQVYKKKNVKKNYFFDCCFLMNKHHFMVLNHRLLRQMFKKITVQTFLQFDFIQSKQPCICRSFNCWLSGSFVMFVIGDTSSNNVKFLWDDSTAFKCKSNLDITGFTTTIVNASLSMIQTNDAVVEAFRENKNSTNVTTTGRKWLNCAYNIISTMPCQRFCCKIFFFFFFWFGVDGYGGIFFL